MKKVDAFFDCPSCGNPVMKTEKTIIQCPFCSQLIVPKGYSKERRYIEPVIVEKKPYRKGKKQ